MSARTFERVETWDARPFSGVEDLRALADESFSGAVNAEDAWLFMLNGRVVGVFDGDVETFETADGTAFAAPDRSLPLLVSMLERGGETRAKYYTNDTPLSEVDDTLSSGNFTGYVELSENVLSGDYYLVYYGGRSMSAAFVGASEELIAGEEAFERADEEVGIYEVVSVDVDVTDLAELLPSANVADAESSGASTGTAPESDGAPESASAPAGSADVDAGGASASDADGGDAEPVEPHRTADVAPGPADEEPSTSESDAQSEPDFESVSTLDAEPEQTAEASEPDEADEAAAKSRDSSVRAEATRERTESTGTDASDVDADDTEEWGAVADGSSDASADPETGADAAGEDDETDPRFEDEEAWRETRSIPTISPDQSRDDGGDDADGQNTPSSADADPSGDTGSRRPQSDDTHDETAGGAQGDDDGRQAAQLREALETRVAELEAARERVAELESETDRLREERDRLETELERTRAQLEEARASAGSDGGGGSVASDVDPETALRQTNLFVRYDTKSEPTLEEVGAGAADDDVNDNLRLDHHTQFDADQTTVEGEPFTSFLTGTARYQFVSWFVRELPYEIRETNHESGLSGLYGALPEVDRAQFHGTVSVETDDGVEERRFDVVLRDRMGSALVVANINTGRDPVSEEMMDTLIEDASTIGAATDLGSAFYVTASFFEPGALESATSATGGGFLSRENRKSFVKPTRKRGFHLCLAESRDGSFYLTVPEL